MEINRFYIAGEFVTPNGKEKINLILQKIKKLLRIPIRTQ